MIIVDTNIIAYLLIPGERTQEAQSLYQKDPDWISSTLWKSEFRSVLSQYLKKNLIKIKDALDLMKEAEEIMSEGEYEVESSSVLRLSKESKCSAYDCEFVALAEEFQARLVTTDKLVLKEFPNIALELRNAAKKQ